MRKRLTDDVKFCIIDQYQNGCSVQHLCEEYGVSKSAIYNWIPVYTTQITATGNVVSARRVDHLERRLKRVMLENDIYRNSGCAVFSPLEDKLRAIDTLKERYNVRVLCSALQVRRSTYYYHALRSPAQTIVAQEDVSLKEKIAKAFRDSGNRYGAKKICEKLHEQDVYTSPRRVRRLMKEMDLHCNAGPLPKCKREKKLDQRYFKNKVNQEFNPPAPNKVWVSDITMVKVSGERAYICVIIDLFSRKVIAANVGHDMSTGLVATAFSRAFFERGCPKGLIFHSDQGGQYTSFLFGYLLRSLRVEQSLSRPGCPHDNAVAESFFAAMKREELNRRDFDGIKQLAQSVSDYIRFYNQKRSHRSLNYRTPDAVDKTLTR